MAGVGDKQGRQRGAEGKRWQWDAKGREGGAMEVFVQALGGLGTS